MTQLIFHEKTICFICGEGGGGLNLAIVVQRQHIRKYEILASLWSPELSVHCLLDGIMGDLVVVEG